MAIMPLVHLNGTSGDRLADDLRAAYDALTVALKALADAAPNARDYYPLGDAAWMSARELHDSHMRALRDMRAEYQRAHEHVQEQLDAQEARHGSR